ncbi:MAG: hypothetical protein KBT36_09345 [Kurthia sp.]|nr:hypothetical protein [Candidatus Kurthia equi]
MNINITDRIQPNKEFQRLGLNDTPYKAVVTLSLSSNIKKPVTAIINYETIDGDSYDLGYKHYSFKQDKDGNNYINLNVGHGYKNLKVNVNEITKED